MKRDSLYGIRTHFNAKREKRKTKPRERKILNLEETHEKGFLGDRIPAVHYK